MKNKGFTLVELISVLVILGLIALVTVTSVSGLLKSYKTSLHNNQLKNIENAARIWASDNLGRLPKNGDATGKICKNSEYETSDDCKANYNKLIVKLSELQNAGYIDKNIKSVKTNNPFNDIDIIIEKSGKKLRYNVSDGYILYEIGDRVEVILSDKTATESEKKGEFYVVSTSSTYERTVKLIGKDNAKTAVAWCTSCTSVKEEPLTLKAESAKLKWNNVEDFSLLTTNDIDELKNSLTNTNWVNGGNFWIDGGNGMNAYYVNSSGNYKDNNGNMLSDTITNNTKNYRPVITIAKEYIKIIGN